jgi:hypothetical protein
MVAQTMLLPLRRVLFRPTTCLNIITRSFASLRIQTRPSILAQERQRIVTEGTGKVAVAVEQVRGMKV